MLPSGFYVPIKNEAELSSGYWEIGIKNRVEKVRGSHCRAGSATQLEKCKMADSVECPPDHCDHEFIVIPTYEAMFFS